MILHLLRTISAWMVGGILGQFLLLPVGIENWNLFIGTALGATAQSGIEYYFNNKNVEDIRETYEPINTKG